MDERYQFQFRNKFGPPLERRKFTPPSEKYIYTSYQIEWNMIVMTVFLSIMNRMEFHLAQIISKGKQSPQWYFIQFEKEMKIYFTEECTIRIHLYIRMFFSIKTDSNHSPFRLWLDCSKQFACSDLILFLESIRI